MGFVKGLEADIDVDKGQTVEYAKNRAVDKMWPQVPFCHAATALSGLDVFDAESLEELTGDEKVRDGMRLVIARDKPGTTPKAPDIQVPDRLSRPQKPPQAEEKEATARKKTYTREELNALSIKELKKVIERARGSAAGCLEKNELVE